MYQRISPRRTALLPTLAGNDRSRSHGDAPNKSDSIAAQRFAVMVVDDDDSVLQTVEAILSLDFEVVSCSGPEEALRCFEPDYFHVVCADLVMPQMDGQQLLSEIARRSDSVCCLLMTARIDLEPGERPFPVVFKPFDPERFLHTVGHLARISEMKRSTRALHLATSPASSKMWRES